MADEIATMVARLDADMTRFEKNINKALGIANTRAASIEKRFLAMNQKIGKIDLGGALGRSLGAIGAGLSLNELRKFADGFTRIQNNLKVAGLSGGGLTGTLEQLYTIAQRTGTPLESLSELFGKVSQAQTTLGATSQELVGFTSIVANAIQVSGKSASEASGALLQLGQSLSGGKIQAEEYNSLLDGMYPLLQAAAAGLKEAGGDVAALTKLVKDGKVSSVAFFRAVEAGAPILEQKLAGATATTSQGMTKLSNDLTLASGKLDAAWGFTQKFNDILSTMGTIAVNSASGIVKLTDALNQYMKAREGMPIPGTMDGFPMGEPMPPSPPSPGSGYATGGTMDGARGGPSRAQLYANRLGNRPIRPVSLSDPGMAVAGSGGGKAKTATENAYQRETKSINEKIAALNAEKGAIGGTATEMEIAKAKQELLTAANEAGKNKNGELNAEITRLATQYGTLKVAVDEAKAAQERLKQANEDFMRGTADLAGTMGVDFKNAILEGASAMDALKTAGVNALSTLSDMLIKLAMQMAVMSAFSALGFPVSPGMFPTLPFGFGGTRAGGGSMQPGRSFMVGENGPERFVPTTHGQVIPNSRSGASIIVQGDTIDARGADSAAISRLERMQAERDARLRRELPALIREHGRHGRMN